MEKIPRNTEQAAGLYDLVQEAVPSATEIRHSGTKGAAQLFTTWNHKDVWYVKVEAVVIYRRALWCVLLGMGLGVAAVGLYIVLNSLSINV